MSANGKYQGLSSVNDVYWRELGVRYDSLNELDSEQKMRHFRVILDGLSLDELKEFAVFNEILLLNSKNKEESKSQFNNLSEDKLILAIHMRDFQNRKKKTISAYYGTNSCEIKYKTPFVQLHHLFKESPAQLFSILTFHIWTTRGTGDVYTLNKSIDPGKAGKVLIEKGFKDSLCNYLYKASKECNEYRIFSYSIIGKNRFIGLLYKLVNDISIPDYKQALRSQGINTLLFELNSEEGTVEIKTKVHFEGAIIKKYIEETFEGVLSSYKTKVFDDYNKNTFTESILNGKTASGKPVSDFLVEKVVFRSSPLKNSPEITIQLRNIDVWPSIIDAYNKGSVNVESIKDLSAISFKSSGVARTIRSVIKDNGNVIFTMDDSLIEKGTVEAIKNKFFEKFGIPMFQEITNIKFSDGQADLIDYAMGQPDQNIRQHSYTREIHEKLSKVEVFKETIEKYVKCKNNNCPHETTLEDKVIEPNECPLCDSELRITENVIIEIDELKVKKEIKRRLRVWSDGGEWVIYNDSSMTYGSATLKLFRLERIIDQKTLQILVADQAINGRLLTKLYKLMTPLIIVFIGQQEKFIEKYSNECIQAISFGKLYTQNDNELKSFFDNIYANLELRSKNYVASAANMSYHSISKISVPPADIDKNKYSYGDLEDDGYALLKDMFPNSVKWGKNQSGKQVPEGVLSISFIRKGLQKEKYSFSFDFKLCYKNEGYPLVIGEQRKAVQYVNDLNNSDLITSYSSHRQLSGHFFISNCFNDAQVETTIKYFSTQLFEPIRTKPIFITTETLSYLHLKYRENHEEVELAKNYYLQWIFEMFTNNSHYVTNKHIDVVFKKLLSKQFRETETMDMPLLTDEITRKDVI